MTTITFRCPSGSKAELMRAWLKRREVTARQDLELVHVQTQGGFERAAAFQAGSRYGATLINYDMEQEEQEEQQDDDGAWEFAPNGPF